MQGHIKGLRSGAKLRRTMAMETREQTPTDDEMMNDSAPVGLHHLDDHDNDEPISVKM